MTPVMPDDEKLARDYREQAAKLRRLAKKTRYPEIRVRARVLAVGFDRLAEALVTKPIGSPSR
jgi:hypothetical protein